MHSTFQFMEFKKGQKKRSPFLSGRLAMRVITQEGDAAVVQPICSRKISDNLECQQSATRCECRRLEKNKVCEWF
jgi:hypothetical protein